MAVTTTSGLSQAIMDVYSKEIYFQAQPLLRFDQFARKKTELGKAAGQKITMMRYNNLTPGGALTENVAMSTQSLSATQFDISVKEYGNAVAVSELLLQTSFTDVMADGAKLLGQDYAKLLDGLIRDTFLGTTNIIYAGGKTARNQVAATDKLTSTEIKDTVEVLATNNAAKYNNDYYVLFVHPHHARQLRDDSLFQNVTAYGRQYAGEIGRIDDVVIIETTQMPVIADAGASSADVYQAVMFGQDPVGIATALPVEMRDGGIEDFGRIHKLAWYSIMGAGIIEENNIVRIETA
jgi:N4-gp56 family major capsid protein